MPNKPTKNQNKQNNSKKNANKAEKRRKRDFSLSEGTAALMAATAIMSRKPKPVGAPANFQKKKAGPITGLPTLSMAAAKYAAAILNPRAVLAQDAYIPIGNGRPTFKTRTINRFEMFIGTGRVGWVLLAPCLSSNNPVAWVTGVTYTGTTAIPYANAALGSLNTGVTTVSAPTGFTNSVLAAAYTIEGQSQLGVFGRVVSASMTASYTGTTFSEGGLLYCFTDPDHKSVVGSSIASIGARNETDVSNISRQKCELVDFSLNDGEALMDRTVAYSAAEAQFATDLTQKGAVVTQYPFASGSNPGPDSLGLSVFVAGFSVGQPCCLVMATGEPGNSIHIEVLQHLEYQGGGVEGRTTPSPVDRLGYETVTAGLGNAMQLMSAPGVMSLSHAFVEGCKVSSVAKTNVSASVVESALGL